MREGPVTLYAIKPEDAGDRTVQVATGFDPETGEVVVFVRLGGIVGAMTPEGATMLADALKVEAAYATIRALADAAELEPNDPGVLG